METQTLARPGGDAAATTGPERILAIDVGAGTQDILLYERGQALENCVKLVLPSQTQIVGRRVRAATEAGQPIHLTGTVMGGGASSAAIQAHLAAGLPVSAAPAAARTIHNNLDRVTELGVTLRDDAPAGAIVIELCDVDLAALAAALAPFGLTVPPVVAVAAQDHGYALSTSNNDTRFAFLQQLLAGGGDLRRMISQQPPAEMTRLQAIAAAIPGVYLMDTGPAAVLGALGDSAVAAAASTTGAVLVNVGNMHTFAVLVRGRRLYGLFEHHTGGITAGIIGELVERLRAGTLDPDSFRRDFDGHGAAFDPAYRQLPPFPFVAITGPNRSIARPLGFHEAAPYGDMMLTGAFGLVEGVRLIWPA